ncbi:MAG: transcriptional repressor, partial [Delftia acidovorans]|nr:transcriptional repressor [Delftia acidovorans]
HLICTRCGLVQEFHDAVIEQRQKLLARSHGFAIVEHSHILYGRCIQPDCERLAGRQEASSP